MNFIELKFQFKSNFDQPKKEKSFFQAKEFHNLQSWKQELCNGFWSNIRTKDRKKGKTYNKKIHKSLTKKKTYKYRNLCKIEEMC